MTMATLICIQQPYFKKNFTTGQYHLVDWATALLRLVLSQPWFFYFILKEKNLYIVSCVQYDIWDITAYFLLPELKYYHEK